MYGHGRVGNGSKNLDLKAYFREGQDDYYASDICELVGDLHRWPHEGLHQHGKQAFARFVKFVGYDDAPKQKILAHDFPFSPPKDVSLLFATALKEDDEELAGAIKQAVNDAADHVLEHQIRNGLIKMRLKHNGREHLYDADGLVVARIWHMLNREGEAQLHPHQLFANRVKLAGRELEGAFRADLLMKDRERSDRIAQMFLAKRLRELGFGTQLTQIGGSLTFTINGIDREVVEANSTRWRQIREAAEKAGFDPDNLTYEQRALCHLKTRKWKDKIAEKEQLEILIANVDTLRLKDIRAARQEPRKESLIHALAEFRKAEKLCVDGDLILLAPHLTDEARTLALTSEYKQERALAHEASAEHLVRSGGAPHAIQEARDQAARLRALAEEDLRARTDLFARDGIRWDDPANFVDIAVELELRRAEDLDGVWTRKRIKDKVLKKCFEANVCTTIDAIEEAYERVISEIGAHRFAGQFFDGGREEADQVQMTSKALLEAERSLVELCRRGRHAFDRPLVEMEDAEAALSKWDAENQKLHGWRFKDEQAAMIRACLAQQDRVLCIQGRAGTGKTTVLGALAAIVRDSRGDKILGCATGGAPAEKLGTEALIPTSTIAGLLTRYRSANGLPAEIQDRLLDGVLVVDEAGMTGSKDMAVLLELADHFNTRVVLVGDTAQLAPVAAGRPFFEIIDRRLAKVVELKQMSRQQDPIQAEAAVHTMKKNAALGLKLLADHGQALRDSRNAIVIDAKEGAGRDIVASVLAQSEVKNETDRLALEMKVREALRESNLLGSTDQEIGDHTVAVGERIRFTSGYRKWGIAAETSARISALEGPLATLEIEGRDPLTLDLNLVKNYTYNYFRTRRHDVIHEIPDKEARQHRAAELAMNMTRAGRDVCVVASTNVDRRNLNNAIREMWRAEGRLGEDHMYEEFLDHKGHEEPRVFAEGDRVICTAKYGGGVKNGDRGSIVSIDGSVVTLALDKGREVTLDLAKYKDLDHAYAVTSYKSQGATHEGVVYLAPSSSPILSSNEAYVAMTRQKYEAHIITDNVEALAERISREQATVCALSREEHGLLMEEGHEQIPAIRKSLDEYKKREAQLLNEQFRLRSEQRLTKAESRRLNKEIVSARKAMRQYVRNVMMNLPAGVRQEMDRHLREWTEKRNDSIIQLRREVNKLRSSKPTKAEFRKELKRIRVNADKRHARYDGTLREMLVTRYDPVIRERDRVRRWAEIDKREAAQLRNRPTTSPAPEPSEPIVPSRDGVKPEQVEPAKSLFAKRMDACRRVEKRHGERDNDKRAQAGLALRRKLEGAGVPGHQIELVAAAIEGWDERREAIKGKNLGTSQNRRAMEASRDQYLEACAVALDTPAPRREIREESQPTRASDTPVLNSEIEMESSASSMRVNTAWLAKWVTPESRRRMRRLFGLEPSPEEVPSRNTIEQGETVEGLLEKDHSGVWVLTTWNGERYDASMFDDNDLSSLAGQVVELRSDEEFSPMPLGQPLYEAPPSLIGRVFDEIPSMESPDGIRYHLPREIWAQVQGQYIMLSKGVIKILDKDEYERLTARQKDLGWER